MNENKMNDSVKNVNDYCSHEYNVKNVATTCVPSIVKVSDGLAQGVFCNAAHNCKDEVSFENLKDPVSIFKMSRYLFPQQDPEPTKAALKDVSVLQALEYIINIASHRLPYDVKEEWDSLCMRDVAFPEITESGVLATHFCLKNEINNFKRAKSKEQYVASKTEQNEQSHTVFTTNVYPSPMASSKCSNNVGRISASEMPIFRWPKSGPLLDLVTAWKDEGIEFLDGFTKMIQEHYNADNVNSLFQVLKHIKECFLHKKSRKRVDRFINLVESRKNIPFKKLFYFVCWIDKVCHKVHNRVKEINIVKYTVDNMNSQCQDKEHHHGQCPEILAKRAGGSQLASVLVDTGAEDSIIGLNSLEEIFQMSNEAILPLGYSLALRGSTGLHSNAILGKVSIELSFLLEVSHKNDSLHNVPSSNNSQQRHSWVNSKVEFLVADRTVGLKNIIVGVPFLRQHRVNLHFLPRPKLTAVFANPSNGRTNRVHLKIRSDVVSLHLTKTIKAGDAKAEFLMTNVPIEDKFILTINNNSQLQLPSTVIFDNFLSRSDDECVVLNRMLELPISCEVDFDKLTLIANVVRISQESTPRIHESSDLQHKEAGSAGITKVQGPCHDSQILGKSAQDTLRDVKFGCNFVSLPWTEQCRALQLESCTELHHTQLEDRSREISSEINQSVNPDIKTCVQCGTFINKCECLSDCEVCKQRRSETIPCKCDKQHAKLLSVKIDKSLSGEWEEPSDQMDCISAGDQEEVSEVIDKHLSSFDLRPPDPGERVDMDHCTTEQKEGVQKLMKNYKSAFAEHQFDIGNFQGFVATIDVEPGSSHIEKERNLRPEVIKCLQPIVDNLVNHGILKLADSQGKFLSNSHGVAKPVAGVKACGKADIDLMRKAGIASDYSRLTVDLR